jgi:hypothetical protein
MFSVFEVLLYLSQFSFCVKSLMQTIHQSQYWHSSPIPNSLRLRVWHFPALAYWNPCAFHRELKLFAVGVFADTPLSHRWHSNPIHNALGLRVMPSVAMTHRNRSEATSAKDWYVGSSFAFVIFESSESLQTLIQWCSKLDLEGRAVWYSSCWVMSFPGYLVWTIPGVDNYLRLVRNE